MQRRRLVQAALAGPIALIGARSHANAANVMDFTLEEATIDQIGAALRAQRTTALALVRAYGERVDTIDRAGPALRSVIELNPEAEAIAQALDAEARTVAGAGRCTACRS